MVVNGTDVCVVLGAIDVAASAAADSVNLDSSGRLLVGTSSTSADTRAVIQGRSSAGDSTGRLHISSGNNGPGDGDGIAELHFTSSGHVASGRIAAQRDGGTWTAGSSLPTRLVFSTTANGASSPTEAFRITYNQEIDFSATSVSWNIRSRRPSGPNQGHIEFLNGGSSVGYIATSTTNTTYNTSSDYRLKENVVAVADGITRLQQLKPSRFNFIVDPDTVVDGFLAHEAAEVVPECVTGEKDAVDDEGNPVYQGIDQSKLVPLLTAALQEAIAKIEVLEGMVAVNNITIDEQNHQISAIETRLTALEGGTAQ